MSAQNKLTMMVTLYLKNTALGALIGFFIGAGFIVLLGSEFSDNLIRYGTYGLAIVATLFASGLALVGVFANLNNQQEIERNQRDQALFAARAVLSLTLSALHQKSILGFDIAMDIDQLRKEDIEVRIEKLDTLRISKEYIEQIKDCIECSDGTAQDWLMLIPAYWQVSIARLEGVVLDTNLFADDYQNANRAVEWLAIKSMISQLFEFARLGNAPPDEMSIERISVPIESDHLYGQHSKQLSDAIKRNSEFYNRTGGRSIKAFRNRLLMFPEQVDERDEKT